MEGVKWSFRKAHYFNPFLPSSPSYSLSFYLQKRAPPTLFLSPLILSLLVMISSNLSTQPHMQWWIQLQVIFLFISIPFFLRFWWDWEGVRIEILSFRFLQSLKHNFALILHVCRWIWRLLGVLVEFVEKPQIWVLKSDGFSGVWGLKLSFYCCMGSFEC